MLATLTLALVASGNALAQDSSEACQTALAEKCAKAENNLPSQLLCLFDQHREMEPPCVDAVLKEWFSESHFTDECSKAVAAKCVRDNVPPAHLGQAFHFMGCAFETYEHSPEAIPESCGDVLDRKKHHPHPHPPGPPPPPDHHHHHHHHHGHDDEEEDQVMVEPVSKSLRVPEDEEVDRHHHDDDDDKHHPYPPPHHHDHDRPHPPPPPHHHDHEHHHDHHHHHHDDDNEDRDHHHHHRHHRAGVIAGSIVGMVLAVVGIKKAVRKYRKCNRQNAVEPVIVASTMDEKQVPMLPAKDREASETPYALVGSTDDASVDKV